MKIQKTNRLQNTINFKAREYALIRTVLKNGEQQVFSAYRLDYSDRTFLEKMSSNIRLKTLTEIQHYPDKILRSWKKIINNAVLMAGFNEPEHSFLLVKEKTPCAIMNYKSMPECYLDNIASWPVSKNNNVKLAGASMFKLLFHNCEKANTQKIGLDVMPNSCINLRKYYANMGFEPNPNKEKFITDMFISRTKMLEISKQMDSFIKIKEIENPKTINPSKVLNIKFLQPQAKQ